MFQDNLIRLLTHTNIHRGFKYPGGTCDVSGDKVIEYDNILKKNKGVIMNLQSRSIMAVILTCIWVNASEFFRNEVILKKYWIDHYQSLGMTFPSEPKNGIIWVAWGFLFAIAIYIISRKFNLIQTTLVS